MREVAISNRLTVSKELDNQLWRVELNPPSFTSYPPCFPTCCINTRFPSRNGTSRASYQGGSSRSKSRLTATVGHETKAFRSFPRVSTSPYLACQAIKLSRRLPRQLNTHST